MYLKSLLLSAALILSACDSVTPKKSAPQQKDTTAPTIELNGKEVITIALHQKFIDPGANASDDFDGDLSNKIEVSGEVNSNKVGTYTLTYSVSDSAKNSSFVKRTVRVTTFAYAKLGSLAQADVKIYKFLDDGKKALLFQEKSSKDRFLEDNGRFDTHADSLEENTLYLIEISGGVDFDSDNNGIKDSNTTTNSGKVRAIVTKEQIINLAQNLNITALSELIYEKALASTNKSFNSSDILALCNSSAKELIKDINSDGVVDYNDILTFDPATHKDALIGSLVNNYNQVASTIKEGKIALLNLSQKIANIATFDFARNITFNSDRSKIYVADGMAGISVIDIKSKKVVSAIKSKDFARHIALSSDERFAFVADSKAGLSVIDIENKRVVANVATYDNNATGDHDARYIQISSDFSKLYLAASKSGVLIFDITNPIKPKKIGTIKTSDIAYNIKLSSDESTLFIADGKSGLIAIDTQNNTLLDTFNTYGSANSVTLSHDETKAYIADGYKGVVVVDISNPSSINYLAHVDTPDFASAVTLNSDETKAFISDRKANIQIVSINQDRYKLTNSIQTPYRTYAIALSDDESYLYAATGTNGIEILATKEITNPFIKNSISSGYKSYKSFIKDDFLYIPEGKAGLQIVNIANPNNPQTVTDFDTDGFTLDIAIENSIAYIADGYKGVKKVDISDATNPQIIDNIKSDGFTSSLQLLDKNQLIISDGKGGIKLIDTQNFTLLDKFTPTSKPLDITLSPNKKIAYVAIGKEGVVVLDIKDNKLTKKAQFTFNRYIKHITIDGNRGYLSGDGSKLTIINLDDGKVIKSIDIASFAYSSNYDDNFIYVANGKDGVSVINKSNYKVIGTFKCLGEARDVAIKNNLLYVASSEGGVCIVNKTLLDN